MEGPRQRRWPIRPSVVLAFLLKNHNFLSKYGGYTLEEDIERVRISLWHDKKRYTVYSTLVKHYGLPSLTEAVLVEILENSRQKKYCDRDSPPYPANRLCGASIQGNDGNLYTSVKNAAGICSWRKV